MESMTSSHAHAFVVKKMRSLRDVSQGITRWLMLVTALVLASILQMWWFQTTYKVQAPAADGTYAEATLGPIDTLNPLYARTSAELSANKLMFSSLFDYDKTGHLRSDVATDIQIDSARKVYTVKLRKDVAWHDGTRLTPKDVVFTVNLMKNPQARSALRSSWMGVEARQLNDETVQFTLPAAYAAFPHALTFSILPQHLLGSVTPGTLRENTFSMAPVGSGPFRYKLIQPFDGQYPHKILHVTRWENYYRGSAKLARFELHAYESQEGIVKALRSGDVIAATDITGVADDELPATFKHDTYPVSGGVFALFNLQSPSLKDPALRQALQRGTNTTKVRSAIDNPPKLDLPFLPYQVNGNALPQKPSLDTVAANKLLSDAGWVRGASGIRTKAGQKLSLRVVHVKDKQYKTVARQLANNWRTLGFDVKVIEFDPTTNSQSFTQAVLQPRSYDVLINEQIIGADPDIFAYWHSSQASITGLNFSNYSSGLADDAIASARERTELNLRSEKYKTFAKQWLQDVPAIALYQSVMEYAHTESAAGIQKDIVLPNATDRYSNILYWTADRAPVYKTP